MDLADFLDFAAEAHASDEPNQPNPHDLVVHSDVWQDLVDDLLIAYIEDAGINFDEDTSLHEIFDRLSWLNHGDFSEWLELYLPHVVGEVSDTVLWRAVAKPPVTSANGADPYQTDSFATGKVTDYSPPRLPGEAQPQYPPPPPAQTPLTSVGLRLCHTPPLNFQSAYGDGVDYGGFQELLYVLWWQNHGCLKVNHWKAYLAFRETQRTEYPFLKNAFGLWNDQLFQHDIYLGMFESGSYTRAKPTVGDLLEFEIFIGWVEYYSGKIPLFVPVPIDADTTRSMPYLGYKGPKNRTVGKRLEYLRRIDPEKTTGPQALAGLLALRFEKPIEHFQAFKAWLGWGDKPLTHQEIMDAGGGSLLFFSNNSLMEGLYQGMFDGKSTAGASGSFGHGYQIGSWLGGYNEGFKGGSSITANSLTFGLTDKMEWTDSMQYQGADYTFSRITSTVSREVLLGALTMGSANAISGGSRFALHGYQSLQGVHVFRSGWDIGGGIDQVSQGDNSGYYRILGGTLGLGGSFWSAAKYPEWNSLSGVWRDGSGNVSKFRFDPTTGRYRDVASGRFIAARNLPWPENYGFASSAQRIIKPGTVIDRFGNPSGRFAGQVGTTPLQRGMVSGFEGTSPLRYEVLKPLPARIGLAAPVPVFGAQGGAVQFRFQLSVSKLVEQGYLRVIK